MSRPPIFDNWSATLPTPWGPYRASVQVVYDGDTVRLWFSMGLDEYAWKDIRLAEVYAPEIRTSDPVEKQHGYEAREHLIWLIPEGSQVRVRTEKVEGASEVNTLGRYVGWLTRSDGLDVNAAQTTWLSEMGYTGGTGA